MIKIGNYFIGEARLSQVVGEGRTLAEAYPNLPSDILEKLQEVVNARFGTKPTKKKQSKKKLNHD